MEQLIILLLIGLISLINWLIRRSAEIRKQRKIERDAPGKALRQEPSEPPRREEEDTERSLRKLMEALGLPEEAPPPLPPPRQAAPERRPAPVSAPAPAPIPRTAIPLHQWQPKVQPAPVPAVVETPSFRAMLATPNGLRNAVLVAEILGPPRALQSPRPLLP